MTSSNLVAWLAERPPTARRRGSRAPAPSRGTAAPCLGREGRRLGHAGMADSASRSTTTASDLHAAPRAAAGEILAGFGGYGRRFRDITRRAPRPLTPLAESGPRRPARLRSAFQGPAVGGVEGGAR